MTKRTQTYHLRIMAVVHYQNRKKFGTNLYQYRNIQNYTEFGILTEMC